MADQDEELLATARSSDEENKDYLAGFAKGKAKGRAEALAECLAIALGPLDPNYGSVFERIQALIDKEKP